MHNLESFDVKPEPPFEDYYHGRVNISVRDNRRMIHLYGLDQKVLVTTYARYLFQVYIWNSCFEMIPEDMEVDHVNEDRLDDRVENLQLLTSSENRRKNNLARGTGCLVLVCPICGKLLLKEKHRVSKGSIHFCSTKCNRSFQMSTIPDSLRDYISDNQKKLVVRVYKAYPSGKEYFCELIRFNRNCFYPKNLNELACLPEHQSGQDVTIVDIDKRISDIKNMLDKGMRKSEIAEKLSIDRDAIRTIMKYL